MSDPKDQNVDAKSERGRELTGLGTEHVKKRTKPKAPDSWDMYLGKSASAAEQSAPTPEQRPTVDGRQPTLDQPKIGPVLSETRVPHNSPLPGPQPFEFAKEGVVVRQVRSQFPWAASAVIVGALAWIGILLLPRPEPAQDPIVPNPVSLGSDQYIKYDTAPVPFSGVKSLTRVGDVLIVRATPKWAQLHRKYQVKRLRWLLAATDQPTRILVYGPDSSLKAEVKGDGYRLF